MAKKTVKYMLTAFRDGFQSVVGARVLSKDFLPCVEEAYAAGVRWFEAGGGARFQSCYFYCQEDAFDVMDAFRKAAPASRAATSTARRMRSMSWTRSARLRRRPTFRLFRAA